MAGAVHPAETQIEILTYRGVRFELVQRADVIWVGCAAYAQEGGEPDTGAALSRYREQLIGVQKRALICPDWSAALLIYGASRDEPRGILFAQETYSSDQDPRYDQFTQSGGLWLRVRNGPDAAALLEKARADAYEYFAEAQILQNAARENGYIENSDVPVRVEYHCHAGYGLAAHTNYAYIPVARSARVSARMPGRKSE